MGKFKRFEPQMKFFLYKEKLCAFLNEKILKCGEISQNKKFDEIRFALWADGNL